MKAYVLVNLGSAESPTFKGVAKFLYEFLRDKNVVGLPRIIWLPILVFIILPWRSITISRFYKTIWRQDGSPLIAIGLQQAHGLMCSSDVKSCFATTYGKDMRVDRVCQNLISSGYDDISVLPLYPQYSSSTTKSIVDKVGEYQQVSIILSYYNHPAYIQALHDSIDEMQIEKDEYVLFSYHGVPISHAQKDGYDKQCQATTKELIHKLGWDKKRYGLSFQSRFGKQEWLKPYSLDVVSSLPSKGIKKLVMVCPGFAADCLETLIEVNVELKEEFLHCGGKSFRYVPCLNTKDYHIDALQKILEREC